MELAAPQSQSEQREQLLNLLDNTRPKRVMVVTGAGISVASGLPTYRGDEGFWTEGSANYEPEEIGYLSTFRVRPRDVWRHNLLMRGLCLAAKPNAAHLALAELEQRFGDDFCLATQNVDGLHLRAGNSEARTIEAHGSVNYMRALDGPPTLHRMPEDLLLRSREEQLDEAQWERLRTPDGAPARPHAMFFDEPYDEALYRYDSAVAAADACELLIVIGTSGATGLPWALAVRALEADAAIVTVDPQESPFALHARNRGRANKGVWLCGGADEWVPELVEALEPARARAHTLSNIPRFVPPPPTPNPIELEPLRAPEDPEYAQSRALARLLASRPPRKVMVLSGAGISVESGLPTFRGAPGALWSGGRNPTTRDDFAADPRGIWAFHLERRGACKLAAPNAAHLALAKLERCYGEDFRLVTQNLDGLHLRAGNSRARTYELHGSLDFMRGVDGRHQDIGDPTPAPLPPWIPALPRGAGMPEQIWQALRMPDGRRARPHVLWWNEAYNETWFRSESALAFARECDLLVVVGTSGVAAMPYAIAAEAVLGADAVLIDINPEDNPYAEHARARAEDPEGAKGLWLPGPASEWVPELVAQLLALRGD